MARKLVPSHLVLIKNQVQMKFSKQADYIRYVIGSKIQSKQ